MTREKWFNELAEKEMVFVNVYKVTREYGGPEEGGWYWNRKECIEVFPTRNINAETIVEDMESEYEGERYGDISSVLGGQDILVMVEETAKQSETTHRPMYE